MFVVQYLFCNVLCHREWHVQGTTATNGEGVPEAMEMLGIFIRNYKERLLTEESLDT